MVVNAAVTTLERITDIKWRAVFNMMYIEPVVFMLVFAHALSGTIMGNQIIYQACVTVFNYNESVCSKLGTSNSSEATNAVETEIQPYVANLFMLRTLLESIVPAVCGVFVGSWSDHYGRKPLLLISMIGFSCTYIIAAGITEVSRFYPINPWYYILTAVPHSFLGGNCVFTVAAFCFISDVTDTKARPYRMIAIEAFLFVGLTTGSVLSSFIYAATNATTVFVISGALMCSATAFIALCVPESLHMKHANENGETIIAKDAPTASERADNAPPQGQDDRAPHSTEKSASGMEKVEPQDGTAAKVSLFSHVHVKDMFYCMLRKRPFHDRRIIWLVTGTMFLAIFVMDGAMTVFYLFVREKFHWTIREFTFYETISHLVSMAGAILGVVIMRKVFKMSIVTLALIAFFSDIMSTLIRGFASETWHLYLSIAAGLFRSLGGAMCSTIVSNIVPATELGKIFSMKNVLQSIAPFLASPLYTFIYKQTLRSFPGSFNIVSASLYGLGFVFLAIVMRCKLAAKAHYSEILK